MYDQTDRYVLSRYNDSLKIYPRIWFSFWFCKNTIMSIKWFYLEISNLRRGTFHLVMLENNNSKLNIFIIITFNVTGLWADEEINLISNFFFLFVIHKSHSYTHNLSKILWVCLREPMAFHSLIPPWYDYSHWINGLVLIRLHFEFPWYTWAWGMQMQHKSHATPFDSRKGRIYNFAIRFSFECYWLAYIYISCAYISLVMCFKIHHLPSIGNLVLMLKSSIYGSMICLRTGMGMYIFMSGIAWIVMLSVAWPRSGKSSGLLMLEQHSSEFWVFD